MPEAPEQKVGAEPTAPRCVRETARHLVDLLVERPEYRQLWQDKAHRRTSSDRPHQRAVARVLAEHLWEIGEFPDTDTALLKRLKYVVSRAFTGHTLAPRTLAWFVGAFAMDEEDAGRLWATYADAERSRLTVTGPQFATGGESGPRPRYRTVSLHEFHEIGPDGRPFRHRTVHVIRALEEIAAYPYRFDTDAAAVEVVRGGTAGPLRRYEAGLFGVDVVFARPLQPGETASFEYRTIFAYRDQPMPRFRRAARQRVENVELRVQFHPQLLPRTVWWAVWPDPDADEPTEQREHPLESDGSVHMYLEAFEAATIGFHWTFD